MAKLKGISAEEARTLYHKLIDKATKLSAKAGRVGDSSYWLSSAFRPCSGTDNFHTKTWAHRSPISIWHFTHQPCDEYCTDKLPMAICLVQDHNEHWWTCRHKVGNCPWKV